MHYRQLFDVRVDQEMFFEVMGVVVANICANTFWYCRHSFFELWGYKLHTYFSMLKLATMYNYVHFLGFM